MNKILIEAFTYPAYPEAELIPELCFFNFSGYMGQSASGIMIFAGQ